ncbi:MAG: DNA topoisomerase I [Candidatus Diapherotrites archaeon]|nr:DNA topoisomerase I [Candidatus Diapherotrites archaeon]
MKLIITEKEIAAAKIAEILANKKVSKSIYENVPIFPFEKNKIKYIVFPLKGHIVDVDFPSYYSSWVGTDIKKLVFVEPIYIEKEKRIAEALKKIASEADEVIIATDADREGESIGVEAIEIIKKIKPNVKIKRAIFSAITPKDINEAFSKLEEVDYNLADSANSRREIDLLWGAALTRFLSLATGRLGKDFLSVGRVQTPVLSLIVSREKERMQFKPKKYWEIKAIFEKDKQTFEAYHKEGKFWEKEKAERVFKNKSGYGIVKEVKSKEKIIKKPLPFNTTEFLRSATTIGFSAHEAMSIAEYLYQSGYISYPRTDNQVYPSTINLKEILEELSKNEDLGKDAKEILSKKSIKPSAGKQTKDHPPIYPVGNCKKENVNAKQWKIYELVVRRFLATLAEDARVNSTSILIDLSSEPYVANGQTVIDPGWKKYYPYSKLSEVILPQIKKNDKVKLIDHKLEEKETKPPERYSQSALIKLMEELGLGTKATRAEIIQKLYQRRYIHGSKAIEPNNLAFAVIDVLQKDAEKITKPDMTAELEKEMDLVAIGKKKKKEVVDESRNMLKEIIDELCEKRENISREIKKALAKDASIGKCTVCNGELRIINSKFGKRFIACSNYPNCKNSFPMPQKGKVTIENKICNYCNNPIIKVSMGKSSYKMCINPNCKSKENWKTK